MGLIEASANIGRVRVCATEHALFLVPSTCAPPPFIDPRREVTYVRYLRHYPLLPDRGRIVGRSCRRVLWSMASGVVVVLANPPIVPRARPCPVAPVDGVAMAAERVVPRVG